MAESNTMHFDKLQGAGNDFVFIDHDELPSKKKPEDLQKIAQKICDRHFSIGADGVVFYKASSHEILIINSDGSKASHCGNALRCLGLKLLQNNIWDGKKSLPIFYFGSTTPFATLVKGELSSKNKNAGFIEVGMGQAKSVILTPLIENSLASFGSEMDFLTPIFVELANPHWVFISPVFAHFTEKMFEEFGILAQTTLRSKLLNTTHSIPPANISMLTQSSHKSVPCELTVYERGAGLTLACGSGATASRIALEFAGLIAKETASVEFKMPGGILSILKPISVGNAKEFVLKGPAQLVFSGEFTI